MRCAVLGPLEVRDGGGELRSVAGAKERHLLAVLAAACPNAVGVDLLLEVLWDGSPPPTGRKSLQAHVVRLRSALEPGRPQGSPGQYVVRHQSGYALVLGREQLDASEFADLVAQGRGLLSAGDAARAGDLLRQALALWRGTPYADWPDSSYLAVERRRLEGVWTNATEGLLEAELAVGRHADVVPDLQRLADEHPLHESWWALLATALYRGGRQGDALAALQRARSVLAEELGVDPGPRLRALEERMLAQDPSLDTPERAATTAEVPESGGRAVVSGCPYKGLAPYQVDDEALFRGRNRLVGALVTTLVDRALLVVSGSSGAGKSSVVRAGLLPALGSGALPGSERWRHFLVTPHARAVDLLSPLTGEDGRDDPVVLVCDQLEQLWSATMPASERNAFLGSVLGLVDDGVVARCVLVVRGDHLGRLAEHGELAERMRDALVLVPPMTEPELRQVVEEPAAAAGLSTEPELVDAAVHDVLGRSGALPLLSAALAGTWERRRDATLTLAGYLATGAVAGAVGRSAEAAYASLTDAQRELARGILVRLAEQGDEGTLRARRVPVTELTMSGTHTDATARVVETFVDRRLLARDAEHVEVAHEALLTAWPRLAAWLEADAVGRSVRRHLAPAAREWDEHGRPVDELYRGTRLDAAVQWAATADSGVTLVEREFLDAGVARSEAELAEANERAAQEAAGRRRTRRFAIGLAAALVLALVGAGLAVRFQQAADERAVAARAASDAADANRLAALSSTARSLDLSMLLAAAAVQTADTPATRDGLLDTLVEHRRANGVFKLSSEGVEETALSADGRTLAATIGGGSPRVVLWRPGTARPARVLVPPYWAPKHIAVSPDGSTLVGTDTDFSDSSGFRVYRATGERVPASRSLDAIGGVPREVAFTPSGSLLVFAVDEITSPPGYSGTIRTLNLMRGTSSRLLSIGTSDSTDVNLDAAFAYDASTLVVWSEDHRRAFWSPVQEGRAVELVLQSRAATSLGFVATPSGALQLWSDGAVTRYDERGRAAQVLDVHRAPVRDAVVLPGGRMAATAGDGGQVELWTIDGRTGAWSLGESLVGHAGAVQQVEPALDGGALLTSSQDGQLISWDLDDAAGFGTTYPELPGRWVSNRVQVVEPRRLVVAPARSRSGSAERRTATGALGPGTTSVAAVFWDPRDGRVVDEVEVGHTSPGALFGSSVAVSPDRRLVAVTSVRATTVVDARNGERVARISIPRDNPAGARVGRLIAVWSAQWTPDGSRLLIGAEGNGRAEILVVDASSWKVTRRIANRGGSVQVMEWTSNGSLMAAGINYSSRIDLFDPSMRLRRSVDLGEGGDVLDLAFSPDGSKLAAARVGGGVTVLHTGSWRPVRPTATMHSGYALDVEWLPDGNTVVSTGMDEVVSLYDVRRDLVRSSPFPASVVRGEGLTFLLPSPTDDVVVLNEDGPGHRYPLDPARWLARACTVAGRDLTRAEWERYMPDEPYRPVCDLG